MTDRPLLALAFALLIGAWARPLCAQALDPRLSEAVGWYTGTAGRVDDARAHALLLEAVADADPISRMWLARCHSTGRMGFAHDPEKARAMASEVVDAIRRLAERGVLEAVFLMGTAHDEALGVASDPVAAASWYRRAGEQGHGLAQHNLGNLYSAGRGVPRDDGLAAAWWRRAAEQGDVIPMLRLGTAYEEGRGVPRDRDEARSWYEKAAARGNVQAMEALERMKSVPGPDQAGVRRASRRHMTAIMRGA